MPPKPRTKQSRGPIQRRRKSSVINLPPIASRSVLNAATAVDTAASSSMPSAYPAPVAQPVSGPASDTRMTHRHMDLNTILSPPSFQSSSSTLISPSLTDETSLATTHTEAHTYDRPMASPTDAAMPLHSVHERTSNQFINDQQDTVIGNRPIQRLSQPTTEASPLHIAVFSIMAILQQRNQEFNEGPPIANSSEKSRHNTLLSACLNFDPVYLVLHQLYCSWKTDRGAAYSALLPISPEVIDTAFVEMQSIYSDIEKIADHHWQWWSKYPVLTNTAGLDRIYSQVRIFIVNFGANWPGLREALLSRTMLPMVYEIRNAIGCNSGTTICALFTHIRRAIGVADGKWAVRINFLLAMDTRQEIMFIEQNMSREEMAEIRNNMRMSYVESLRAAQEEANLPVSAAPAAQPYHMPEPRPINLANIDVDREVNTNMPDAPPPQEYQQQQHHHHHPQQQQRPHPAQPLQGPPPYANQAHPAMNHQPHAATPPQSFQQPYQQPRNPRIVPFSAAQPPIQPAGGFQTPVQPRPQPQQSGLQYPPGVIHYEQTLRPMTAPRQPGQPVPERPNLPSPITPPQDAMESTPPAVMSRQQSSHRYDHNFPRPFYPPHPHPNQHQYQQQHQQQQQQQHQQQQQQQRQYQQNQRQYQQNQRQYQQNQQNEQYQQNEQQRQYQQNQQNDQYQQHQHQQYQQHQGRPILARSPSQNLDARPMQHPIQTTQSPLPPSLPREPQSQTQSNGGHQRQAPLPSNVTSPFPTPQHLHSPPIQAPQALVTPQPHQIHRAQAQMLQTPGIHHIQPQIHTQSQRLPSGSPSASTHLRPSPSFTVNAVPSTQHPHSQYHWTSLQAGLHLAHLRSPRRISSSPDRGPGVERTRYYQFFSKYVLEPRRIQVEIGSTALEFDITREELESLAITTRSSDPGAGDSSYEIPVSRHFDNSHRYRFRLCAKSQPELETTVDAATWSQMPTRWPPYFTFSINGKPIQPRRKHHFHHDLPIELTDSLVEGKNTIKTTLPYYRENVDENLAYFMAVELITTLNHNSVWELVVSGPHTSVEEAKDKIQRQLQATVTDELVIKSDTTKVTVADPISSKFVDVPVRGRQCLHLECFDLQNWLATRPSKPSPDKGEPSTVDDWRCPICRGDARPCNLVVDDFFSEIRDTLIEKNKRNTKQILLHVSGTWTPIEDADEVDESPDRDVQQDLPGRAVPPGGN